MSLQVGTRLGYDDVTALLGQVTGPLRVTMGPPNP